MARRKEQRRLESERLGRPAFVPYSPTKCRMHDCDRVSIARGHCRMHYSRLRIHGDAHVNLGRAKVAHLTCTADGCSKTQKSSGYCQFHYMRWRRNGDAGVKSLLPRHVKPIGCSVEGCDHKFFARGVCQKHYKKLARVRKSDRSCTIEGCGRPHEARGYCGFHYGRLKAHGDPLIATRAAHPIGGKVMLPSGYVLVRIGLGGLQANNKGWALEHRHIVARRMGRRLLREENVHHIDGDKTNNDPSNLELWSSSQPSGQRIEDKVAWAREILATYGHLFEAKPLLKIA
jgi:hypothetical protein